jgi:bifunctional DNA-binding transcriptional regulator/antitoxin component of YhaV-PrlF toxin-antitoxin module
VAELRKALKIGDGDVVYLFATTLKGEEKVIIRTKKTASDEAVPFGL